MTNKLGNLLGNTAKNTSNVDAISDKIAQNVVKILLSSSKIDALNLNGKKDLSGGRKLGNIDTARYTTISENQNVRMRKGDGVANILARLYVLLKGSHDEEVKQMELTRNFKEEKLKEGGKYSKVTHKKNAKRSRKPGTKIGLAGLAILGLISSVDSIMNWMENFTAAGGGLDTMVSTIKDSWQSFKETVYNTTNELYQKVFPGRDLGTDWEEFKGNFKKTIDTDIEFGKQVFDDFKTGISETISNVSKIAEGVKTTIFQKADEFATWVGEKYNYAMSTVTWVIDTFSNFKSMISKHLQSISAWFTEALKNPSAFLYGGGDLSDKIGKNNDEFIKSQKAIDANHPEGGVINAGITAAKQIFNDVNYVAEQGATWSASAGKWIKKDLGVTGDALNQAGSAIGKAGHVVSEKMNAATAYIKQNKSKLREATPKFIKKSYDKVKEFGVKLESDLAKEKTPYSLTRLNEKKQSTGSNGIITETPVFPGVSGAISEKLRQVVEVPRNSDDYSQRAATTSKYQPTIKTITKNKRFVVPGGKSPNSSGLGTNADAKNKQSTYKQVSMKNIPQI